MTIVSHTYPFLIGVDTHARTHTLAIVSASSGEQLDCEQFPASTAGMKRAIDWAGRRTGGDLSTLWAIEGIGTYGAKLARMATDTGYLTVEAPRTNTRARRGMGKSDPLDAQAIASAALSTDLTALRHPRQDDGTRAALRVLVASRDQMTVERTANVNALIALLRTVELGIDARKPLNAAQIDEIARWRTRSENLAAEIARAEAVRLAKRVLALTSELKDNQSRTEELIQASKAAPLLEETGI